MISKISALPLNEVNRAIKNLMEKEIVEKCYGKAIKRKDARFKKGYEVHKHHSYYRLTEKGKHLLRKMDEKWFNSYLKGVKIENKKFSKTLTFFIKKHIGKSFKINTH